MKSCPRSWEFLTEIQGQPPYYPTYPHTWVVGFIIDRCITFQIRIGNKQIYTVSMDTFAIGLISTADKGLTCCISDCFIREYWSISMVTDSDFAATC